MVLYVGAKQRAGDYCIYVERPKSTAKKKEVIEDDIMA
jgi:hypothetical protein